MQSDVRRTIVGAVRAEMARRGVTQHALAEKLGRPQPWLAKRLLGQVPFRAEEIVSIAQLLEVDPAVLLPAVAA